MKTTLALIALLGVTCALQTVAASDWPTDAHSRDWGLTAFHKNDSTEEKGWSETKPAEYHFRDEGVDLVLCFQWGCNETTEYFWDKAHIDTITGKIAACASSAENELLAIRNAVRDAEKKVMRKLPFFNKDIGGNKLDSNRYGRLDCVDNSSNTNTLLRILEARKPFQFWKVHRPQRSGIFKPHQSAAVITDNAEFINKYRPLTRIGRGKKTVWVVDSWLTTFSHKPFLYEVNDWKYELDPWGNKTYFEMYSRELACWK